MRTYSNFLTSKGERDPQVAGILENEKTFVLILVLSRRRVALLCLDVECVYVKASL